jgi:hypothetical protein
MQGARGWRLIPTIELFEKTMMSNCISAWDPLVRGGHCPTRTVWGCVRPTWARISDFIHPPRAVLAYLSDLVRSRAVRHVGRSPAGGAMVALSNSDWQAPAEARSEGTVSSIPI